MLCCGWRLSGALLRAAMGLASDVTSDMTTSDMTTSDMTK